MARPSPPGTGARAWAIPAILSFFLQQFVSAGISPPPEKGTWGRGQELSLQLMNVPLKGNLLGSFQPQTLLLLSESI